MNRKGNWGAARTRRSRTQGGSQLSQQSCGIHSPQGSKPWSPLEQKEEAGETPATAKDALDKEVAGAGVPDPWNHAREGTFLGCSVSVAFPVKPMKKIAVEEGRTVWRHELWPFLDSSLTPPFVFSFPI